MSNEENNTEPLADISQAKKVAIADKSYTIRGRVIFGAMFMIALVGGVGGWAATAKLSGAVIAPGSVVVEKNVKKVQHRDGGIVSRILAKMVIVLLLGK